MHGDANVISDPSSSAAPNVYATRDNSVLAFNLCRGSMVEYSIDGFFGPVDNGIVNTVKGGSTVPLQFRVYDGDNEVTDPAVIESFTAERVACPDEIPAADEVEVTLTGSTELRYTDGKFLQLWKTPKVPGCYEATITTTDGTTLTADFRLRYPRAVRCRGHRGTAVRICCRERDHLGHEPGAKAGRGSPTDSLLRRLHPSRAADSVPARASVKGNPKCVF